MAQGDQGTTSEEINRLIAKHAKPGVKFTLEDVRGHRAVGVGLEARVGVVVDGEAGDFLAAFNAGAMVVAKGSVGRHLAYGMTAGSVQVVGSALEGAGAYLHGGAVHIFGDVGPFAGFRMSGGEVVVKDSAQPFAGAGMQGGELAVLGPCQGTLGEAMGGGTIFARAGSAFDGASARAVPLDEAAARRLAALAAAVKVVGLDPSKYMRVVAAGEPRAPAAQPTAPGPAHVRVSTGPAGQGPRVTVTRADDAPAQGGP